MKSSSDNTKIIAFYLPQFHPIKENNDWWGTGFTEWTNVSRAKPLYPGHVQPKLPSELGFYDLRLPDVAKQQAELAREYGIYGFCYYYYWFGPNKQLLERPLNEMLASGSPDFPFCLCWTNENWTRRWDGAEQEILMRQEYSDEVAEEFIESLLPSFRDKRYIRIGDKPLLLVYDVRQLPQVNRSLALWRKYVKDAGFDDLYIVRCNTFVDFGKEDDPVEQGFDACMDFPPHGVSSATLPLVRKRANHSTHAEVLDYKSVISTSLNRKTPPYKVFRGVMSNWDNTPRKPLNPIIFFGSTPPLYEFWLRSVIDWTAAQHKSNEQLVFVFAWNEWAEGATLEPDMNTGRQYLEATRHALKPGSQSSFSVLLNEDVTMRPANHSFKDGAVVRNGNRLKETDSIKGKIDKLSVSESLILIEGWAAEVAEIQGDLQILVFDGENLIGATNTCVSLPENAGELGIKSLRCGFRLHLNDSLDDSAHLRVCALNSNLCWKQLQLQEASMDEEKKQEFGDQVDYFSRCQTELIVLTHASNYSGKKNVLLVGQREGDNGFSPHKIDLVQKNAQAAFGKDANLLFLEFSEARSGYVTLSSLKDHDISLNFELPAQRLLLLQILQTLNPDTIEFLDKSRSEKRVTEITDALSCTRERIKVLESNNNVVDTRPALAVQDSSKSRLTNEFGEIEAHEKVENPIVSVCLPVRNAERSIAATLKSILGQNLESIEVLAIDDCSDDSTFDILMAFAKEDRRLIPWQNVSILGKTACFNECLMRASGRYIKPLEQTAILSQGALSMMAKHLDDNPEQVLVTSLPADRIAKDQQEDDNESGKRTLKKLLRSGIFSLKEQVGNCSQLMFRVESIGRGFDSSLNHFAEIDYWMRILLKGDLYVLPYSLSRADRQKSEWFAENKYYIEMSSELLTLKENWKSDLVQLDLDSEALFDQAMVLIASKFAAHENKNGKNGVTRLDPEIVSHARLQETTMHIMRTLGRCQLSTTERDRKYILMLERQLRGLLSTYSWRFTRPLRELNAIVLSKGAANDVELPEDVTDIPEHEYAHYLRDLIKKVKASRSWKLTAAFRRFGGGAKKLPEPRSKRNV